MNLDGIVDMRDFAIFAEGWRKDGCCCKADIDNSRQVDEVDMYLMSEEWLETNWLYGLQ